MPRKLTEKQKKAVAILVEDGGSVSGAMRKAGYSPATAKTPSKLTDSPAFIDYLEKAGVTDQKLAQVLNEGLNATKAVVMAAETNDSFVDIQPDYQTRHKYLETAIKVKGHVKPQDGGNTYIFNKGDIVKSKYIKE